MDVGGKILTGTAATILLALIGHLATADNFISNLEENANTELKARGLDNITATFDRDPIYRSAVLDGEVSDEIKQEALSAVAVVPGVSNARWSADAKAAEVAAAAADANASPNSVANPDANSGENVNETAANAGLASLDPETKSQVTKCQNGVDRSIEGQKLSFRSGSAYVSPASNKILDEVAAALKPCSGLSVAVGGHTDGAGNAEVNKILSQERADRVRQGLIDRGIAANLVTATGYGAEKPLTSGNGANANAQNRRIEFTVGAKK